MFKKPSAPNSQKTSFLTGGGSTIHHHAPIPETPKPFEHSRSSFSTAGGTTNSKANPPTTPNSHLLHGGNGRKIKLTFKTLAASD